MQLHTIVAEQLLVLLHQRVLRLGEDTHQILPGQPLQGGDDRHTAYQLGDDTELQQIVGLDLLEQFAGMAIYDTMQYIKCDVSTICIGMAASMGAFLLSSGAKGKRIALPNAEIMIHQPSAGTQGKVTDMEIDVEHFLKIKQRLNKIMAENTGKTPEQIKTDSERDNWMIAEEAREYGLVDKVIYKR